MGDVSEAKEIFTELKRQILERVDLSRDVSDEEMQELIDEVVISYGKEQAVSLNERCRLKKELFHALRKMDVLQELLEEPDVTEIMVNGMNGIFLEKDGTLSRWEKNFYSGERILDVIRQITGACNRAVNESQPIVDAQAGKRRPCPCGAAAGGGQRTDHHDTTISKRADDHETAAGDGQYLSGGD